MPNVPTRSLEDSGLRELPKTEPSSTRLIAVGVMVGSFALSFYLLYHITNVPDFLLAAFFFVVGIYSYWAAKDADLTDAINSGHRVTTLMNETLAHAQVIARRNLEALTARKARTEELRLQVEEEELRLRHDLIQLARLEGITVELLIDRAAQIWLRNLDLQSEVFKKKLVLDAADHVDYYKTVRALENEYEELLETLAQVRREKKGDKKIRRLRLASLERRMARVEGDLLRVGVDIDAWKRARFLPT